jgi:hypothetical protein
MPRTDVRERGCAAIDAYLQLLGGTVDAGVGLATALVYVGPYAMIGHGWRLAPGTELRLDGGGRWLHIVESYPSGTLWGWSPMALASVRHGRFAGGVWADGLFLNDTSYDRFCDETCVPEYFVRSRLTIGIYLRVGSRLL